jgi:hypothetical protein
MRFKGWMLALAFLLLAVPARAQVSDVSGTALCPAGTPTVSACGSGAAVSGSNCFGTIAVGSGLVTSCTLTFSTTLSASPACVVTSSSGAASASASTTALSVTLSAPVGGGTLMYHCLGL